MKSSFTPIINITFLVDLLFEIAYIVSQSYTTLLQDKGFAEINI